MDGYICTYISMYMYTYRLDAVIQNHINGVSAWLRADKCTVGGTPIVVLLYIYIYIERERERAHSG